MENNKSKAKSSREDKSGAAKLQEQIDKVDNLFHYSSLFPYGSLRGNFHIEHFPLLFQIIKSLGSASSTDEKIALLAKNFIELERENNRQNATMRQNEKVLDKEQREKEHLQREYNKSVLVR